MRERWEAKGGLDTREWARAIARRLLREHRPKGLPQDLDRKIRKRFPHIALSEEEVRP